jgi:ketosteroid isomerase-like protein
VKAEAPKSEAPRAETPKAEAPRPETAKVETKAAAKATPAPTPVSAAGDAKAQVTAAVEEWARAWSTRDVKGYLAAYAADFEVPDGLDRAAWEKQRAERIQRPKSIEVVAKVQSLKVEGNDATATIRQSYRSDTLKTNSTKTLKLVKSGDRWLIKQERVGG